MSGLGSSIILRVVRVIEAFTAVKSVLIGTVAAGLIVAAAFSQSLDDRTRWQSLTDETINAYRAGAFNDAAKSAKQALNLARSAFGVRDPDTLNSMNNLANVLDSLGRDGEAEPLYRETLDLRRQVLGPKHPDTLSSMNNLAFVLQSQGHYDEAEPLYRETLDLRREVLGPMHPDTLTVMNNLASVLGRLGRYGEAETLDRETLDGRRQVSGSGDPNTVASMSNLAIVLQSQGRYGEAEPLCREALRLYQETLGPMHPDTLTVMNNLASLLSSQGRYREAEPLDRETLDGRRQVLGRKHPQTLISMNNLAAVLERQNRNDEAEPLLRETLDLYRQVLGPKDPETLMVMNNLAGVLNSEGRYPEAEPLYREALDLYREVLGSKHPDTLTAQVNLVVDLAARGKVAEAVALHREMELLILDRLGTELYTTELTSVRRQMVASQSIYQDIALTLALLPSAGATRADMAASALLRFKGLAVEEDAYLARLAQRGEDEHIRAVAGELQGLHAHMARLVQGSAGAQEVNDLTARMDAKQHELSNVSRKYAASLQVRNASLQDLRGVLAEQSALLEMRLYRRVDFKTAMFGPARLAGVLITSAGVSSLRDLGPAEDADTNVNVLLSGSPEAAERASAALYRQLLAPFDVELSSLKRLYVAPDGMLNLVSFGLLRDVDGKRVMNCLDVRLVQTGRDLLRPVADKPAKGLVAIGGIDFDLALTATKPDATPAMQIAQADVIVDRIKRTRGDTLDSLRNGFGALTHSKEEVETIADLYGDARRDEMVKVAEGATPTKDWLLGLSPPRVLHLATHGFYRAPKQPSDQPMLLAGIALAGANRSLKEGGDGGILYALEAQDLDLEGTELVVLSACQTALGQYDYGDGVSGLVRALRVAGARNVLVTLRSVDDEQAAKFMQRFYFHWLSQKQSDPTAALRDAQAEYASAPTQDTTWTSFIIVGE